jgi:hypothetical protein
MMSIFTFPFEVWQRDASDLQLDPTSFCGPGVLLVHPAILFRTMSYNVDSEDFDSSWRLMISLFSETAVSPIKYVDHVRRLISARFHFSFTVGNLLLLRLIKAKSGPMTGIYLAFFLLAIYTLSRRRKVPGIKILMVLSCVMAALGTTQVAVIVAATVINAHFIQRVVSAQASNQPGVLLTLGRATSVTFAINGCVISLHRFKSQVSAHGLVLQQTPSSLSFRPLNPPCTPPDVRF